jgi:hypothetical protein
MQNSHAEVGALPEPRIREHLGHARTAVTGFRFALAGVVEQQSGRYDPVGCSCVK